jgi:hypothetical protein
MGVEAYKCHYQFHSSSLSGAMVFAPAIPLPVLAGVESGRGRIISMGVCLGFRSGFMTEDGMRSSESSSRREVEVAGDVIGEVLKYDGVAGRADGDGADVVVEVEAESGDGETDIAEARDCDMSEKRREARF